MPLDLAVMWVHEMNWPLETAAQQIAGHRQADGSWLWTGADQGHRAGRQQRVQVSQAHRLISRCRHIVQPGEPGDAPS